jgi:hypothetical protein
MKTGKQKQPMTANPETVALIAAILDPKEVRRTEPTNEIPNCLLAAVDLVKKAQKLMEGSVKVGQLSPEWKERLGLTEVLDKINIRARWKLNSPEQYTLAQAVSSDWCKEFKSEHKLKAFLKRFQFPFEIFDQKEILITRAAYELALELESQTPEGKERARKRKNCSAL